MIYKHFMLNRYSLLLERNNVIHWKFKQVKEKLIFTILPNYHILNHTNIMLT